MSKFLYPSLVDAQEVFPVLRDALRGKPQPVDDSIHAVYVVTGFGLSLSPGQPGDGGVITMSDTSVVTALEPFLGSDEVEVHAQLAVPWEIIIPILLDVAKRWLDKRRSGARTT